MNKKYPLNIAVYIASAFISYLYCAHHWVVGPVFATAYFLIYFRNKNIFSWKNILFFMASTLTYALVFWIVQKGYPRAPWEKATSIFGFKSETIDFFSIGVISGSLILPVCHSFIYSVSLKHSMKISALLIFSWYASQMISWIYEALKLPDDGNPLFLAGVFLWQGIYMYFLKAGLNE